MPWGIAVAAAGAIGGALISSNATSNAASTQAASTQAGLTEQQREYDTNRSDQAPYRAAGVDALGQIQSGLNTPVDPTQDPGYQFGLTQGQQAINRQTAAAGGRISGAALKSADQYATDYATTGYSAAYQRGQDRLNRLQALAGIGQTATAQTGALGQANTNQQSSLTSAQGNAGAAAQLSYGNIWGGAANQLTAAGLKYINTPTSDAAAFQSSPFNNSANYG